ncbi:MAG: DNA modification methylase [Verrucomicrobia bacterium]|nr:MAG: DNA modification methylase [Verrucomicrobiota bacterium]
MIASTPTTEPYAIQQNLAFELPRVSPPHAAPSLIEELKAFRQFGQPTRLLTTRFASPGGHQTDVPTFVNEFWTAKQRQASSLHEISYRACFKPQLPRFFIERLTQPGDLVYDPFMGRGTTPVEAALLGRVPLGNDANPLSTVFTRPRLHPPTLDQIEERLRAMPLDDPADVPEDLLAFYHPETLRHISSLKKYLLAGARTFLSAATSENRPASDSNRAAGGHIAADKNVRAPNDPIDDWIAMVALNRLTGHSNGFFSVYTLPPNQAVSARSQRKINERRNQTPPERDVIKIILKKSRQLLGDVDAAARDFLSKASVHARVFTGPANATPEIASNSVSLVVTSPPFLNVVQYATDNWLRCWFLGIDPNKVQLTVPRRLDDWQVAMTEVFRELARILKPGGHVAFEVGEVHAGKTKLEEAVLPCGVAAGLEPVLVLINDQKFTKTANCWGVDNMAKGTNTNRIVLFRKS